MFRIGTCGWAYGAWKGILYPQDAAREEMLSLYVQSFQTVEINNTFYRLPEEETVRRWREKAPEGFLFAVKASRYITHLKHLLDAEGAVNQFLGRVNLLEEKLGPILFQLSPQWHINAERLRNFVAILPEGRRYAFEFRHHSWYTEEIFQILEEGGCGFCIHDHRDAPSPEKITARFAYVRLHCSPTTEGGHYTTQELAKWAKKLVDWETQGIEIYCYFNNDWEGYAVNNGLELKKLVEERRGKGYSY